MLSAVDFAYQNRVPVELSAEMAEFAMFTIDMGEFMDENHAPILPHLKGVDLFRVKPVSKANRKLLKAMDAAEEERKRQANLALYISRGYAFESADGQEIEVE